MSERETKKSSIKEISPLDVYKLLPRTNCKVCGEENCMAFATKLVNQEILLESCTPLLEEGKYKKNYQKIWDMVKPPVRSVTIGTGENAVTIGGEFVMYRHEFTYYNPTAIAIDISDEMTKEEIGNRSKLIQNFEYHYIGQNLRLDLIAVRSTSSVPEKFSIAVKEVIKNTNLPLILCSHNPEVVKAGLKASEGKRPLIYAATKDNWLEMTELASTYNSPLVVSAPNDLDLLRSLSNTILEYGIEDIVLDSGTFPNEGLGKNINNLTMLRRASCKKYDELLGFPLMGNPMVVWFENTKSIEDVKWKEAYLASMLITRYSDIIVLHSLDGWVLLPLVILRENLYTDPRKPVAVDAELKVIGKPNENSPVLFTTNFALTYYTVASDIEKIDCYLIVIDTEGLSVESAVAGRKLTADKVGEAIKEFEIEKKVKHKKLIIPGRAARLSGEIEEVTGWDVLVGPLDSSGIIKFLNEKWKVGEIASK
ncbi:MAG: acetyl-CoA decarbonylase/synthase complex subunit gamma [Candidatus Bathyarchaeota archaeon]|nr:acetyl-CoA decarbonylase/synthase complex subunit gamma [Candidatus Bathyarchaeota archaeon]